MDITEFLAARLDEDELFAGEAVQRRWYATDNYIGGYEGGDIARFEIKADARHAAVWNPARVLADVAAKRAILAQLQHKRDSFAQYPNQGNANGMFELERVTQVLASAYVDHPDFDPAWRVRVP